MVLFQRTSSFGNGKQYRSVESCKGSISKGTIQLRIQESCQPIGISGTDINRLLMVMEILLVAQEIFVVICGVQILCVNAWEGICVYAYKVERNGIFRNDDSLFCHLRFPGKHSREQYFVFPVSSIFFNRNWSERIWNKDRGRFFPALVGDFLIISI